MSELSKEELIEVLKNHYEKFKNDKGKYIDGVKNGIDFAIIKANQLTATPSKPVVPKYVADWFEDNKGDLEFNIFAYIREWNDHDYNSEFYKFMNNGNGTNPIGTLIKMQLYGYEVEQPKRWVIENENKFRLSKISGSAGSSLEWSFDSTNKKFMIFEDFGRAKKVAYLVIGNVAELIGGELEEV